MRGKNAITLITYWITNIFAAVGVYQTFAFLYQHLSIK